MCHSTTFYEEAKNPMFMQVRIFDMVSVWLAVTTPISTTYVKVDSLALVDDKVLVVLGDKDNKRVVTKYGILGADSGRELGSVDVKKNAAGLAEVMLDRKPCVAMSYWWVLNSTFRDPIKRTVNVSFIRNEGKDKESLNKL